MVAGTFDTYRVPGTLERGVIVSLAPVALGSMLFVVKWFYLDFHVGDVGDVVYVLALGDFFQVDDEDGKKFLDLFGVAAVWHSGDVLDRQVEG